MALPQLSGPAVRVIPLVSIGHLDRGWTRGHVTGCIDEFPPIAPGYLQFGPILLAAVQEIDARAGYPMHHHEAIETLTLVLTGTLAHDDSVGGRGFTGPDDVAVVFAGSGVDHEEMALDEPLRAVMFWVRSTGDAPPAFHKRTVPRECRRDRLVVVASGDHAPDVVPLRTNVTLATGVLSTDARVRYELAASRSAYVISTDAAITVNELHAAAGDRVLVSGAGTLDIQALGETELVLLDVECG